MIKGLTEKLRKEKIAASLDPTQVPNLLKTVRMKIGHDEFEQKIGKKADLKYVETFKGTINQLIKTEKFFLLMVNELLKLMQHKPEECVYTKNKKIALMIDHLTGQVNSLDFTSQAQPLSSLNWAELKVQDGELSPTDAKIEFIDAPILRQDHKSLPVSQRIRRYKTKRTGRSSVLSSTEIGQVYNSREHSAASKDTPTAINNFADRYQVPVEKAMADLLSPKNSVLLSNPATHRVTTPQLTSARNANLLKQGMKRSTEFGTIVKL